MGPVSEWLGMLKKLRDVYVIDVQNDTTYVMYGFESNTHA